MWLYIWQNSYSYQAASCYQSVRICIDGPSALSLPTAVELSKIVGPAPARRGSRRVETLSLWLVVSQITSPLSVMTLTCQCDG